MSEDSIGLVGTTIAEKYLVEKVVGEGGFAVVYRASHLLWKRPVAVKVFRALANLPPALREELTQDFIREGALLAELSEKSASICQARDVGVLTTPDGTSVPYMVLEWLEGESLEAALQREQAAGMAPRSLLQTVRLLDHVAEALALAHARGIAHRDVKPANVFLLGAARDDHCAVKLLDFGIAKVVQDIQKTGASFNQTGQKVRSFTPAYASPEQFSRSHGATGPWTDVFALALVAVELLTGKPPLDGDDFLQIGFSSGNKAVRPTPRTRGATTSDEVEAVFERALATEIADRYASADAFWQDLRVAAGLGPSSAVEVSLKTSAPEAARSARFELPGKAPGTDTARAASAAVMAVASAAAATASTALQVEPPRVAKGPRWVLPLALAALPIAGFVAYGLRPHDATSVSPPLASASAIAPAVLVAASPPKAAHAAACPDGMVFIRGGTFFMGSDEGMATEKPAHKVEVPPYCVDIYEVTTAKYIACSNGGWCKRAATTSIDEGLRTTEQEAYDALCNERDPTGRAQHPINCVTWEMADVYCRSNKVRLPTEAEWEFAARGSDGRQYPWGDEVPSAQHLNACGTECAAWAETAHVAAIKPMYQQDDHWPNTAPVGSFPQGKSQFGVLDLAGNVWEWVADWSGPYTAGDGVKPEVAPVGPAKGTRKVIRGGGWNGSDPSWERPSFRYSKDPADRNHGIGFRCAATPQTDGGAAP